MLQGVHAKSDALRPFLAGSVTIPLEERREARPSAAQRPAEVLEWLARRHRARHATLPKDVAFLAGHGFGLAMLAAAAERGRDLGVPAHRVLIAQGRITEAAYLDHLAREAGVRRWTDGASGSMALEGSVEAMLTDRVVCVREPDGRRSLLVVPGISIVEQIWDFDVGRREHLILASEAEFVRLLWSRVGADLMARILAGRMADAGMRSARDGLSRGQRRGALVGGMALATSLALFPSSTLALLAIGLSSLLLFEMARKCLAMLAYARPAGPVLVPSDRELPEYCVIVALKDETRVLGQLLAALTALDYPVEKLDIILAVEELDRPMRTALADLRLPPHIRVLVIPPGPIETKPRALNAALLFATGDLVTIFDAEDIPAPDQLRKAAGCFAADREIACLQASLVPDNPGDGPLQALFALEYAALFDVLQGGLCALDMPLPLGGTSNHFRRSVLVGIGGWDSYNVTEDAELGLRLWRAGLKLGKLASLTVEEAPHDLKAWFNQRRRWSKGWLQTLIAHGTGARLDHQRVGGSRAVLSLASMAGTVASLLLYPLGALAIAFWVMVRPPFAGDGVLPMAADGLATVAFCLGLVMLFVPAALGIRRRSLGRFSWLLPLLPFYQMLVAAASWMAVIDLWRSPFYWSKTEHGLARTSLGRATQRLPASLANPISLALSRSLPSSSSSTTVGSLFSSILSTGSFRAARVTETGSLAGKVSFRPLTSSRSFSRSLARSLASSPDALPAARSDDRGVSPMLMVHPPLRHRHKLQVPSSEENTAYGEPVPRRMVVGGSAEADRRA